VRCLRPLALAIRSTKDNEKLRKARSENFLLFVRIREVPVGVDLYLAESFF
jgi:hypothetical protein